MRRHTFVRYIAPNLGAMLVLALFMTDDVSTQTRAVGVQTETTIND